METKPILFSGPMVRALLNGSKTQTRRVAKGTALSWMEQGFEPSFVAHHQNRLCPYGQPGDRLWVRETWNWFDPKSIPAQRRGMRADFTGQEGERQIKWCAAYAADGPLPYPGYDGRDHWRPSIHMPRWASRITLEITGVRVERLQDISEADAIAEGVEWSKCPTQQTQQSMHAQHAAHRAGMAAHYEAWIDYVGGYRWLWESLNGPGSWEANPWVWVVEFKRIDTQA